MTTEVLFNICKTIFKYLDKDELKATAKSILKILDISVDFQKKSIEYFIDADESVRIPLSLAEVQFKFNYKTTYYKLSLRDELDIQTILNDNDDIASSFYPLLDCIGYILIRESNEGEWRIKWKIER